MIACLFGKSRDINRLLVAIDMIEMVAGSALSIMHILDGLILARQKLGARSAGGGIVSSSAHCGKHHDELFRQR